MKKNAKTRIKELETDSKFYRGTLQQIAADTRHTRAQRLASSALRFIDAMKEEAAKAKVVSQVKKAMPPLGLIKPIRVRDSEGSLVQDGDRIQFSYGTPVIGIVAKVIQRGKSLIALTPRHSPKECSLRDLRKFNIDFRKV
jgi:hypothetical protein